MPTWLIWTAAIAAIDALLLIWNYGAHRKPNWEDEEQLEEVCK